MRLIIDRSAKDATFPKAYAFNTYFYGKIVEHDFVPAWTKRVRVRHLPPRRPPVVVVVVVCVCAGAGLKVRWGHGPWSCGGARV